MNNILITNGIGLMQLFQTVQDMQEQLKQVHETALLLASEKEDKQLHTNVWNDLMKIRLNFLIIYLYLLIFRLF